MGYNCGSGGGNYSCGSSGCSNHVSYDAPVSEPQYTARFYSSTPHENFTDVKYSKVSADYDKGAKEIIESVQGPPLLAYVTGTTPDIGGGGSGIRAIVPASQEVIVPEVIRNNAPKEEILNEILRAQQEVMKKHIVFKEVEIEEKIMIHRRIRRTEVFVKGEEKDNGDRGNEFSARD